MGYSIDCDESRFRVIKPQAALAALKAANRQQPLFDFEQIPAEIESATTLVEALQACCWDVELDEDERIAHLFYEGKILTNFDDLERLFGVLAPFVESGSFLILRGEDDAGWRYSFRNGQLRVEDFDPDADDEHPADRVDADEADET
jgi:hypothetical protein